MSTSTETYSEADYRVAYRTQKEKLDRFVQHAKEQGFDVESELDDEPGLAITELLDKYPSRRPYVIEGLLRRGEIMNIIAAPKVGKSWMIYGLLICVAEGCQWFGFPTRQVPVLLIDNELHKEELSYRLREVAFAMKIDIDSLPITVEALRGKQCDINAVGRKLSAEYKADDFGLIFIDSFYRMVPMGVSENDNSAITGIYNQLDAIARQQNSSIAQIHHASKGNQNLKDITDVGAGAGAMTRATDTHLIIRPHEKPGLAVFDAVTRSSKQPQSFSAAFEWPLWSTSDEEPELKKPKNTTEAKKESEDAKGKNTILTVLDEMEAEWLIRTAIRKKAGMGSDRCNRLLRELLDSGDIEMTEKQNPRNKSEKADFFRRVR